MTILNWSFHRCYRMILCLCAISVFASAPSAGAEAGDAAPLTAKPPLTITATPVYQFDAALHNGSVSIFRLLTDVNWNKGVSETTEVGLHLGYDYTDYHFSGVTTFAGGVRPWGAVHRLELGGSIGYDLTPEWTMMIAPSVQISREEDAGWGNALGYGGVATLTRDLSPNLTLGVGVAGFSDVEDVNVFPVLVVYWRITDRLLLANPFRPGPTGSAGIELSYRIGAGWDAGVGAAYRSNRFRLASSGPHGNGVGEASSTPGWVRISRSIGDHVNCDFYSGAMFGGMVSIDDATGNRVVSDHYDPAPFLALALSGKF